mmetsp:Transcript_119135/g.331069  ORF Transcript_119135/g.331069 Transcript_119135/m.331069 type:complete len:205 (+) Transcript_119135:28-642(+)
MCGAAYMPLRATPGSRLLALLAPDHGPLVRRAVEEEEGQAAVAELHDVPRAVLLPLGPLRVREGLPHVLQAVRRVAREVVGPARPLVPAPEDERAPLHLPPPVDGGLAVLLRRGHGLLHLLVAQHRLLPRLVLRDLRLEGVVLRLHQVLLHARGHRGPDLLLVAGDHLVHDAAAAAPTRSGAQHGAGRLGSYGRTNLESPTPGA